LACTQVTSISRISDIRPPCTTRRRFTGVCACSSSASGPLLSIRLPPPRPALSAGMQPASAVALPATVTAAGSAPQSRGGACAGNDRATEEPCDAFEVGAAALWDSYEFCAVAADSEAAGSRDPFAARKQPEPPTAVPPPQPPWRCLVHFGVEEGACTRCAVCRTDRCFGAGH